MKRRPYYCSGERGSRSNPFSSAEALPFSPAWKPLRRALRESRGWREPITRREASNGRRARQSYPFDGLHDLVGQGKHQHVGRVAHPLRTVLDSDAGSRARRRSEVSPRVQRPLAYLRIFMCECLTALTHNSINRPASQERPPQHIVVSMSTTTKEEGVPCGESC